VGFQKLGDAAVDVDRILAIRPRYGSNSHAVEIVFENGESIIIDATDPKKTIEDYLVSVGKSATAPLST
jgi:hypothetical protein